MSQLREYEVTLIIDPDVDEEKRNSFIENFTGVLTHGEGEEAIPVPNHWGERQLAYPIKKKNKGYYLYFDAKLNGPAIRDIERDLNYNETVLRYLFVRKEEQ